MIVTTKIMMEQWPNSLMAIQGNLGSIILFCSRFTEFLFLIEISNYKNTKSLALTRYA